MSIVKLYIHIAIFLSLITSPFSWSSEIDFLLKSSTAEVKEFDSFNKCLGQSVEPFLPEGTGLDTFAESGKSCIAKMARGTDDIDISDEICGCFSGSKGAFLKWQVESAVSSRIKGEVEQTIREELIRSARSKFLESFEAAQHVERMISDGDIKKEEVSGLAACSADAFTKGVFEEIESRGDSCSSEAKEKGLKLLFGTSDQKIARDFLSRIGNKNAKNAILPEDKEKGYCFGNTIVQDLSYPAIEEKTALNNTSLTSIFDPNYAKDYSTLNDSVRASKAFLSKDPMLVQYSFDAEGEEKWPRNHTRGMTAFGNEMETYLRKNPLLKIAANVPRLYKVLQHIKPSQWNAFLKNPVNLKQIISGPNKTCNSLSQKGDDRKVLGDIICGSHKPSVDGHTFITTILPRVWEKAGERDGNLIAVNYLTNNFCQSETIVRKRGRRKGESRDILKPKKEQPKLGDVEERVFGLGSNIKTEIERDNVPQESDPTPSMYDSYNKALCKDGLFKGCEKDPSLKKCNDLNEIEGNLTTEVKNLVNAMELNLDDVDIVDSEGAVKKFSNKDELIDYLLQKPEGYLDLVSNNISDEEYYGLKTTLSTLFVIRDQKAKGETKFSHFQSIGKDSTEGRPSAYGMIANTTAEEVAPLNNHYEQVGNTPVGQEPPPVPYTSRLGSSEVDTLINTPIRGVDFSDQPQSRDSSGNTEGSEVYTDSIPSLGQNNNQDSGTNESRVASEENPSRQRSTSSGSEKTPTKRPEKVTNSSPKTENSINSVTEKPISNSSNDYRKESALRDQLEKEMLDKIERKEKEISDLKNQVTDSTTTPTRSEKIKNEIDELQRQSKELKRGIASIGKPQRDRYLNKGNNGNTNGFTNNSLSGANENFIPGAEDSSDDSSLVSDGDNEKVNEDKEKVATRNGSKNSKGKSKNEKASSSDSSNKTAITKRFGSDGLQGDRYKSFGQLSFEYSPIYSETMVNSIGLQKFVKIKELEGMTFRTVKEGDIDGQWELYIYDFVVRDELTKKIKDPSNTTALRKRYKYDIDALRPIEKQIDLSLPLSEQMKEILAGNNLTKLDAKYFMIERRDETEPVATIIIGKEEYLQHEKHIVSDLLNKSVAEKAKSVKDDILLKEIVTDAN